MRKNYHQKFSKSDNYYALLWAKKIKAINQLGGRCIECKTSDIFVLEFHHSGNKEGGINSFLQGKNGVSSKWTAIQSELRQCVIMCRNCHAEHHNPEMYPLKKVLLELKGENRCSSCGYSGTSGASLDFHHRIPDEKEFKLSDHYYHYSGKKFTCPLSKIVDELSKCDLLCRNCHTKHMINIERFNRLKDYIYYKVDNYEEKMSWDRVTIKSMMDSGHTRIEIANKLGCSRYTIYRELRRMEL